MQSRAHRVCASTNKSGRRRTTPITLGRQGTRRRLVQGSMRAAGRIRTKRHPEATRGFAICGFGRLRHERPGLTTGTSTAILGSGFSFHASIAKNNERANESINQSCIFAMAEKRNGGSGIETKTGTDSSTQDEAVECEPPVAPHRMHRIESPIDRRTSYRDAWNGSRTAPPERQTMRVG